MGFGSDAPDRTADRRRNESREAKVAQLATDGVEFIHRGRWHGDDDALSHGSVRQLPGQILNPANDRMRQRDILAAAGTVLDEADDNHIGGLILQSACDRNGPIVDPIDQQRLRADQALLYQRDQQAADEYPAVSVAAPTISVEAPDGSAWVSQ